MRNKLTIGLFIVSFIIPSITFASTSNDVLLKEIQVLEQQLAVLEQELNNMQQTSTIQVIAPSVSTSTIHYVGGTGMYKNCFYAGGQTEYTLIDNGRGEIKSEIVCGG